MFFPFQAVPVALSGRVAKGGGGHSSSSGGHSSSSSSGGHTSSGFSGSSTKSGSSGSSSGHSSGGSTVVVVSTPHTVVGHDSGGGGNLNTQYSGLPLWVWILIGVGAFVFALFFVAFIYHAVHERRLARTQSRKPSLRRPVWKALKIALFLWISISIYRCCCGRKRKTGSTSYRKVDNAGELTANNNIYSSSMGYGLSQPGPSGAAYGDGGSGSQDPASEKYEPMGYLNNGGGSGTTAVSVGGTSIRSAGNLSLPPYSPNSAFEFPPTAYAPTNTMYPSSVPVAVEPLQPYVSSSATAPVHITPTVSPMATPTPTPAATASLIPPQASATYVPGHDSHPIY